MFWVVVILKEGWAYVAAPALLLVWHRLFRIVLKKNKQTIFYFILFYFYFFFWIWHRLFPPQQKSKSIFFKKKKEKKKKIWKVDVIPKEVCYLEWNDTIQAIRYLLAWRSPHDKVNWSNALHSLSKQNVPAFNILHVLDMSGPCHAKRSELSSHQQKDVKF